MGPVDLYLVRHAIAEPRDSERWPDDASRPLTENGVKLFRAAARGLRSLGVGGEQVRPSVGDGGDPSGGSPMAKPDRVPSTRTGGARSPCSDRGRWSGEGIS